MQLNPVFITLACRSRPLLHPMSSNVVRGMDAGLELRYIVQVCACPGFEYDVVKLRRLVVVKLLCGKLQT
jgi:hypothetical protein